MRKGENAWGVSEQRALNLLKLNRRGKQDERNVGTKKTTGTGEGWMPLFASVMFRGNPAYSNVKYIMDY